MNNEFPQFVKLIPTRSLSRYCLKMILLFIIGLLLSTSQMYAQHWGENNPQWHYEQVMSIPNYYNGYHKISVIGDTILNGETARIFFHEYHNSPDTAIIYYHFMKSSDQKVYSYISELEEFKLLYDFNAVTGDTFKIWAQDPFGDFTDSMDITIDSTSTILVNGVSLKVQYFRPTNYWGAYEFEGRIIEGIGWDGFMFPQFSIVDPPFGGDIRCFEDNLIGLYQFNLNDCDYIGIRENPEISYSIYPNPVSSVLHIKSDEIPDTRVYSSSGQLLSKYHSLDIDFQHLPSGLYFLTISFSSSIIIEKVMKL